MASRNSLTRNKTLPPAVGAWSHNNQTTRKVPTLDFFFKSGMAVNSQSIDTHPKNNYKLKKKKIFNFSKITYVRKWYIKSQITVITLNVNRLNALEDKDFQTGF